MIFSKKNAGCLYIPLSDDDTLRVIDYKYLEEIYVDSKLNRTRQIYDALSKPRAPLIQADSSNIMFPIYFMLPIVAYEARNV